MSRALSFVDLAVAALVRVAAAVFLGALLAYACGCSAPSERERGDDAEVLYRAWCEWRHACGVKACDVPTLWGTYCQEHDCRAPAAETDDLVGCVINVMRQDCRVDWEQPCMADLLDQR